MNRSGSIPGSAEASPIRFSISTWPMWHSGSDQGGVCVSEISALGRRSQAAHVSRSVLTARARAILQIVTDKNPTGRLQQPNNRRPRKRGGRLDACLLSFSCAALNLSARVACPHRICGVWPSCRRTEAQICPPMKAMPVPSIRRPSCRRNTGCDLAAGRHGRRCA